MKFSKFKLPLQRLQGLLGETFSLVDGKNVEIIYKCQGQILFVPQISYDFFGAICRIVQAQQKLSSRIDTVR
ncbi:hypothetical protein AW942_07285 [Pseudomonas aeruginosa]|nr:hypothetical protein AW899_08560 [Pseudomonas aeruginosa]OFO79404.1 hypothetical protein HMPREF3014_06535 [Pseudomonas sp. HMSC065H01]OFR04808.1 hypothetical protein HMPREF2906_28810 [Pseudomonas sp. HMSC065H02]KXC84868.1 hypothetical protein AW897_07320 [Pseudomonas aeruginosa]KXC90298.1 hypothetical protein AW898_07445 [Pseudomonas aeruginosa]